MNNEDLIHNQTKHMNDGQFLFHDKFVVRPVNSDQSLLGDSATRNKVIKHMRKIRLNRIKKSILSYVNAVIALILILGATTIGWVIFTIMVGMVDSANN